MLLQNTIIEDYILLTIAQLCRHITHDKNSLFEGPMKAKASKGISNMVTEESAKPSMLPTPKYISSLNKGTASAETHLYTIRGTNESIKKSTNCS